MGRGRFLPFAGDADECHHRGEYKFLIAGSRFVRIDIHLITDAAVTLVHRKDMEPEDRAVDNRLLETDPVHPPGDQPVPREVPGSGEPGELVHARRASALRRDNRDDSDVPIGPTCKYSKGGDGLHAIALDNIKAMIDIFQL